MILPSFRPIERAFQHVRHQQKAMDLLQKPANHR